MLYSLNCCYCNEINCACSMKLMSNLLCLLCTQIQMWVIFPSKICQTVKFACASFVLYSWKECKRYMILIHSIIWHFCSVQYLRCGILGCDTVQFGMWVKGKGSVVLEIAMKAYVMTGQFHTLTALSLYPLNSTLCWWYQRFRGTSPFLLLEENLEAVCSLLSTCKIWLHAVITCKAATFVSCNVIIININWIWSYLDECGL